jgi:phage regulator Rha-like protein
MKNELENKQSDLQLFKTVEEKIIEISGQKVLIDSDVAELYGVETKRINEALRNNPDKFPKNYSLELQVSEKEELVENFDRFATLKHSTNTPHAFTEKGLYMLANILKSPRATQTTIAIVEAFAELRELSRNISELTSDADEYKQKTLMKKIISKLCHNDNRSAGRAIYSNTP